MDKEDIHTIAEIIKAETKGGYLKDWRKASIFLLKKQQDAYFEEVAKVILKKLGWCDLKPSVHSPVER